MTRVTVLNQSSKEFVRKTIKGLGLTEVESNVYIFLAKRGPLKGGETARNLKMPKSEVYHVLKSLEGKGWVQLTLEFPARFTAVPIEKILDSQIKLKREEALLIENTKKDILLHWSSFDRNEDEAMPEMFVVVEGLNKIFVKIFQMIEEAEDEIRVLMSGRPLVQTINVGTDQEVFKKLKHSEVQLKILTQVSRDNFKIIEEGLARASKQGLEGRIESRHLTDSSFYCRFLIKDKQQAIFFLTPRPTLNPTKDQEDAALWTDSAAVVNALNAFFGELWSDASDVHEKLKEMASTNLPR